MKAIAKPGTRGPLTAVVLAFLTFAALPATPQPPAGAGAGRQRPRLAQMAGLMMYLERSWAIVAFEFDLTDEQLTSLRALYKAAWDTRQKALREPGGDLAGRALALSETLDQVRRDIDAALADVLTEDQIEKWEEIKQDPQGPLMQGWWLRPRGAARQR